jgi:NAD(P)-dependent dehydrogenase (short-subunit alcohol dehydrogenase family)
MFNLNKKIALITGASEGLGKAMAIALSKQGAKIVILDVKDKEGINLAKKLKGKYYSCDISKENNIKQTITSIKEEFGRIDILINNAGIFYPTPIDSTTKESWERLMSINVTSYFLMARYCVPLMKKGSKIINISSVAGHHAFAGSSAYNSSKGAVIQLTKSMAMEYASKGINVNAICPGIFVTPMTRNLIKGMKVLIENSVLLKRAGKAEEIGSLAVYLSSDECSYMTGSIITFDGGWTCHL